MICPVKASPQHPDAQLVHFTPDAHVLVLVIAHYEKLCRTTSLTMVSGIMDVKPIWRALSKEKTET